MGPLPLLNPPAPRRSHAHRPSASSACRRGCGLLGDAAVPCGHHGGLRPAHVDDLVAAVLERRQAHRLADAALDLLRGVGVLGEELPCVLPALAQLLALVREPGTGLLHDLEVDADVEERALLRDALAVRSEEHTSELQS